MLKNKRLTEKIENNKIKIKCKHCNSNKIIRKGLRKNKLQNIQKYKCKSCNKYFTLSNSKNTTYPVSLIVRAISLYNLGYSLKEVSEKISNEHFVKENLKNNINISTVSSWLKKYKGLTTYNKLREQAKKLYTPKNIIFAKTLQHKQVYLFKYHKAKLKILPSLNKALQKNVLEKLVSYLEKIPTSKFPHHIFNKKIKKNYTDKAEVVQQKRIEQRASNLKFEILSFIRLEKNNYANKLAGLALQTVKNNYERHQIIQNFMLTNDTSTVAIEVPVYLTNDDIKYFLNKNFRLNLENYQTPITGHIDILQIRNNLIHILDYKPEASKINPINQLTIYALALSSRLQIPLKIIKVAWFDENNYFEFFPLHAVYSFRNNLNLKFNKVRR